VGPECLQGHDDILKVHVFSSGAYAQDS